MKVKTYQILIIVVVSIGIAFAKNNQSIKRKPILCNSMNVLVVPKTNFMHGIQTVFEKVLVDSNITRIINNFQPEYSIVLTLRFSELNRTGLFSAKDQLVISCSLINNSARHIVFEEKYVSIEGSSNFKSYMEHVVKPIANSLIKTLKKMPEFEKKISKDLAFNNYSILDTLRDDNLTHDRFINLDWNNHDLFLNNINITSFTRSDSIRVYTLGIIRHDLIPISYHYKNQGLGFAYKIMQDLIINTETVDTFKINENGYLKLIMRNTNDEDISNKIIYFESLSLFVQKFLESPIIHYAFLKRECFDDKFKRSINSEVSKIFSILNGDKKQFINNQCGLGIQNLQKIINSEKIKNWTIGDGLHYFQNQFPSYYKNDEDILIGIIKKEKNRLVVTFRPDDFIPNHSVMTICRLEYKNNELKKAEWY